MSSSLLMNNTFHFNSFMAKFERSEEVFDLEEKNHNMSLTMQNGLFNFSGEMQEMPEMQEIQEIQEMQLPTNIKENEMNMSEQINLNLFGKKDQGFDKSSYSIEQNFNENSHMILEEEFEK